MKRKFLRGCAAVLSACAVLTATMPIVPMTASAANIIKNSTFESGTSDWGTYKESGGACTLTTSDGKLALNITNIGKVNYAVQVFYDIVPLYKNGVYRLKYDISSTIDRDVEGMIQQNGGTYQAYTWKMLHLTSSPQSIDYTFTMEEETDIMAKLVFNCGIQDGDLPAHTIYLDNVSLELVDDSKVDYNASKPYESPIVLNQLGYRPNDKKIAVLRTNAGSGEFSVVDAQSKKAVYTGKVSEAISNSSAGETDYLLDFSDFKTNGTYCVTCGSADASYPFVISDNPYGNLLDESVRMLYLQRCGCSVQDTDFSHAACHTSKATIYGTNDTIDVNGGWHDAGDYGRYVVPGAKTIADLLYAYEANPKLYGDSIGIPESGNGVPDVLDEARYELEWMLKMQASSGGVYHKVSCANFPGYVMPTAETAQLIVTPVSTTATADFCASMALASEFYQAFDADFAKKCLSAAERAWSFLQQNPNLIFKNPADIVTGDYGDTSDRDERYWAAAQMYRATGDQTYLTALEGMTVQKGFDWTTVGDYGNLAILTMDGADKNSSVYQKAKNIIVSQADSFVSKSAKSPYGVALTSYNWGSNMTVANAGMILGISYQLTNDTSYLTTAQAQLDYLLGRNPLGTSFVTGYGTVAPKSPHHRPSMAVGKAMPAMLVGGVNSNLEDSAAKAYLADAAPAKCYVDNSESYSTNEITIYWNSPLTYLMTLTDSSTAADGPSEVKGDVNADGKFSIADVVCLQKWLLQSEKSLADWKAGDFDGNGLLSAADLALMKKALI